MPTHPYFFLQPHRLALLHIRRERLYAAAVAACALALGACSQADLATNHQGPGTRGRQVVQASQLDLDDGAPNPNKLELSGQALERVQNQLVAGQ